ncbi:MAG: hypothetical protein ABS939_02630 [Psychrobacillus sp.]
MLKPFCMNMTTGDVAQVSSIQFSDSGELSYVTVYEEGFESVEIWWVREYPPGKDMVENHLVVVHAETKEGALQLWADNQVH